MKDTDIFIGVSSAGCVTQDMVRSMNTKSIVLAMANPIPEIMPDLAKEAGAFIVGTGRSDFPNQVNNSSAFPGLFRGVLDARAKVITDEMKLAAARAIAEYISDDALSVEYIMPDALNREVADAVAMAVYKCAVE